MIVTSSKMGKTTQEKVNSLLTWSFVNALVLNAAISSFDILAFAIVWRISCSIYELRARFLSEGKQLRQSPAPMLISVFEADKKDMQQQTA
ncbi:hypothetical protein FRC12_007372 [Ceratobasidium sp. 428]|nr:hypothetical protein FRC12_007372 [Ceratobasidium sp. 428]